MKRRDLSILLEPIFWLCLAAALSSGVTAEEIAAPPLDRLRGVVEAALEREAANAIRQDSAANQAAVATEGLPGGPVFELQTEGLGSGFGHETNAADSLRLRKELALPSQRSSARSYREAARQLFVAEEDNALAELAARVGGDWLELAAALDLRSLLANRLSRLDRAVLLHKKRLELGEVAGAEVRQLELQRARERARLTQVQQEAEGLLGRLRRVAGEVASPGAGDLEAIVLALPTLGAQPIDPSASPWIAAARQRARVAEQHAEMIRHHARGLVEAEAEIQHVPSLTPAESFDSFGFRVAIPLPLGRKGRLVRAAGEARAQSALASALDVERELEQRLAQTSGQIRSAETLLEELAVVEAGFPMAEQSLAERFRLGAISYLVYVDGLSRLDELREDLIDTRLGLLRARLALAVLLDDAQIFPLPTLGKETSS